MRVVDELEPFTVNGVVEEWLDPREMHPSLWDDVPDEQLPALNDAANRWRTERERASEFLVRELTDFDHHPMLAYEPFEYCDPPGALYSPSRRERSVSNRDLKFKDLSAMVVGSPANSAPKGWPGWWVRVGALPLNPSDDADRVVIQQWTRGMPKYLLVRKGRIVVAERTRY